MRKKLFIVVLLWGTSCFAGVQTGPLTDNSQLTNGAGFQTISGTVTAITGSNTTISQVVGLSGSLSNLTSGTTIAFTQTGTGSKPTTIYAKLRSYPITPQDFGAIADGSSHPVSQWLTGGSQDRGYSNLAAIQVAFPFVSATTDEIDWAASQAAVNASVISIPATSSTAARTVLIPGGNYVFNQTLSISTPGQILRGDGYGTTLIQCTDSTKDAIKIPVSVEGICVENMQILGTGTNSTAYGIEVRGDLGAGNDCNRCKFDQLIISGFSTQFYGNGLAVSTISNSVFTATGTTATGIHILGNSNSVNISACETECPTGIQLSGGAGIQVDASDFAGTNVVTGLLCDGAADVTEINGHYEMYSACTGAIKHTSTGTTFTSINAHITLSGTSTGYPFTTNANNTTIINPMIPDTTWASTSLVKQVGDSGGNVWSIGPDSKITVDVFQSSSIVGTYVASTMTTNGTGPDSFAATAAYRGAIHREFFNGGSTDKMRTVIRNTDATYSFYDFLHPAASSLTGVVTVPSGGTGSATLSGIPYASGTLPFIPLSIGSGLTLTGSSLSANSVSFSSLTGSLAWNQVGLSDRLRVSSFDSGAGSNYVIPWGDGTRVFGGLTVTSAWLPSLDLYDGSNWKRLWTIGSAGTGYRFTAIGPATFPGGTTFISTPGNSNNQALTITDSDNTKSLTLCDKVGSSGIFSWFDGTQHIETFDTVNHNISTYNNFTAGGTVTGNGIVSTGTISSSGNVFFSGTTTFGASGSGVTALVTGTAVLVGGSTTIANSNISSSSRIIIGDNGGGILANMGSLYEDSSVRVSGTMTIKSLNVLDTSKVTWQIINP